MATKSVNIILHNFKTLLIFLLLINARFSSQTLLSISRRVGGDTLKVSSPLLCRTAICSDFGAVLITKAFKLSSSCTCQCRGTILNPVNTFYEKTSKCLVDRRITESNGCRMTAKGKTRSYSSLIALNASMTSPMELTLLNTPSGYKSIKLSKWSYYHNDAWHDGVEKIFSVTSKSSLLGEKTGILTISNQIPKALSGALLKVSTTFVFPDVFNSEHCLMFKVLGTYIVAPKTTPPTTAMQTTVTVPITKRSSTSTPEVHTDKVTNPEKPKPTTGTVQTSSSPTIPKIPNKNTSTGKRERLLIAIATSSVAILVVVLLVCIGACWFFRRQRRCKEKKDIIQACTRPSLPRPADPASPPHNYEYVVYPALTNSLPPPFKATSLDNAMYGRGPDNELIIRTPAASMESLISKHTNNSTKSNHSTLPHPQDYTPLETALANESNSIYQPLIRPHTPQDSIRNDSEKGSSEQLLNNHCEELDKINDEDFSYEVRPHDDDCGKGDDDDNNSSVRPTTYLEPSTGEVPDYMELEEITSYSTTV